MSEDACQRLMLHPYITASRTMVNIFVEIRNWACSQPWETEFNRYYYMPSPYYPAGVVLFQLHEGMVSHMQVLATPSSTVYTTKYLDPYH